MKLHSLILDDFLEDFEGWRTWADGLTYQGEVNPVDGVVYPGICREVPTYGTALRLQGIMGGPVTLKALFLRLSLQGVSVPHQAHTDALMGRYSLMLYMNRPEHCQGGTGLVRHVSGLDSNPTNEKDAKTWLQDTNLPQMWEPYLLCEMKPNRAFIFRSDLFHCAFPIGGFGTTPSDGRLVMTAFFDA